MYSFLLIEDSEEDYSAFRDTVVRLNKEAGEELYRLDIAATYDSSMEKISDNFSGVIVDIKLDGGHSGNEIIREIIEKFRVPVAIFTGTPDIELDSEIPIRVYKKGEASHEKILQELCAVSNIGIFNVLGRTGSIEKIITEIFWRNLFPQIEIWKEKKEQGIETEKILLRYAVSHIQEYIDNEVPEYVTEEMYIKPPVMPNIKTGTIFQSGSDDNSFCIVLSPPCDLAIHGGKFKTDRILACEIDGYNTVHNLIANQNDNNKGLKADIKKIVRNNYSDYYHCLPKNDLFVGGYINFRKVMTYSPDDFIAKYGTPKIKVQAFFVKSILNRFSAYYARQGQPDFNFVLEANRILDSIMASR